MYRNNCFAALKKASQMRLGHNGEINPALFF